MRGRLMDQRCAGGAMAVAVTDARRAAAAIDAAGAADVAVAVINSEHSVVLSGRRASWPPLARYCAHAT
ncbi:hypothetical protein I547_7273 [Mycobacterium kansasii 824]|nr:hypothetical protein I547_7273 [Mycobacterium kansasii 824]